jgi:hypothetical protein
VVKRQILPFIILLVSFSTYSKSTCKYIPPDPELNKALKECKLIQSTANLDKTSKEVKRILETSYCLIQGGDKIRKIDKLLCEDPNGEICFNQGKFFDSNCNFLGLEIKEAESTPGFVKSMCEGEKIWDTRKFSYINKGVCLLSGMTDKKKCREYLALMYPEEKAKIIRDQVYTQERIKKVKTEYKKVKDQYIAIINSSTKMSAGAKAFLIEKIKYTRLALEPKDIHDPASSKCHDVSAGKSMTAVYNRGDGIDKAKIHICSGLMTSVDHMNSASLIHLLAHELTHSIDPCMLENGFLVQGYPRPNVFLDLYGDTIKCLRGGVGKTGCQGSKLNCQEKQGIEDHCSHYCVLSISKLNFK